MFNQARMRKSDVDAEGYEIKTKRERGREIIELEVFIRLTEIFSNENIREMISIRFGIE